MLAKEKKNIVITGGNSGVGLQTAIGLVADGHNVIFGSRNEQRNRQAVQEILQHSQNGGNVRSFSLDLSKRASIQKFSQFVHGQFKTVHILVNNAGLIMPQFQISELNIEMTMTINHFGPFYLTYLLLPLLKSAQQARIINVSSMAHYQSGVGIANDLACRQHSYSSMGQYSKSKLANVLFTVGLSKKLSKYPNIKTASLHPGIVSTNFGNNSKLIGCFRCICCCLFVNQETGARTSLHLSRIPFEQIRNGEYYHSDTNWKEMNQVGRNDREVNALWTASQEAYDITFDK